MFFCTEFGVDVQQRNDGTATTASNAGDEFYHGGGVIIKLV
jgi:hypothetical protein